MTDNASPDSAKVLVSEEIMLSVNSDRPYIHPGENGCTPAAMTEDHTDKGFANSNNPTQAPISGTAKSSNKLMVIWNYLREGEVFNKINTLRKRACNKSTDANKVYNNGKTCCLFVLLLMTSIIVVVIFARLMATGTQAFVTVSNQRCVIMIFCILGLLSTFFLLIHRLPHKEGYFISTESENINDKVLHKWEKRMQLTCVCIFGLAGAIVPDIYTFVLYRMCHSSEVIDLPIAECYILLKIFFTIGQVAVLFKYSNYRCQTFASRVSVLLLIPANIGNWLNLLATESVERIHKNHEANLTVYSTDIVSYHDPDEVCIIGDSGLADYEFVYYPLAMEFCILTTSVLFEIWGLNSDDGNAQQVNDRESRNCKERLSICCNKIRTSICICVKKCSPTRICNWICANKKEKCLCIIPFVLGVMFAVFLIAILSSNMYMFKEETVFAYCICYLILNFFMLVIPSVAWAITFRDPSHKIVFGPSKVLLIGSTCVLGFWIVFELIALCKDISSRDHAILFTADIFFIFSIYFQSSLLLENEYASDKRPTLFAFFSILSILNMYMWIEDSIFSHMLDIKVHMYMDKVYDSLFWSIIKLIFLPPCIFYRIQAAEMCVLKCVSIHQKRTEQNESAPIGNISDVNKSVIPYVSKLTHD